MSVLNYLDVKYKKKLRLEKEPESDKDGNDLLSHYLCSTIGAGRFNFSVRNGKRWNPAAIVTLVFVLVYTTITLDMMGTIQDTHMKPKTIRKLSGN